MGGIDKVANSFSIFDAVCESMFWPIFSGVYAIKSTGFEMVSHLENVDVWSGVCEKDKVS